MSHGVTSEAKQLKHPGIAVEVVPKHRSLLLRLGEMTGG